MSCDYTTALELHYTSTALPQYFDHEEMAVQNYSMPVILPDLRREESYHQIVDALEYLDAVANDVFNRISCRYVSILKSPPIFHSARSK